MRVLFLGGNALGERCYDWLATQGVALTGYWTSREPPPTGADLAVSAGYRYKVAASFLAAVPTVNLHTGYLPFNRGRFPNVWPLLDGTPAGATLHWMDAEIDTGDVIARARCAVEPWDTAWTLYRRLEQLAFDLFTANWAGLLTAPRIPQHTLGPGTKHLGSELAGVTVRLDERRTVREVINILRARSFPGYPGVQFTEDGQTWDVGVVCRSVPRTSS